MTDAVACPGCERPYDRARFAEGRAVRCTCGSWVGGDRRTGIGRGGRPRFAADAMLGGLPRRRMALGYDTWWDAHLADAELVRRALAERRVIHAAYPLDDAGLFSRCTLCNHPLQRVLADDVPGRVPRRELAGALSDAG